MRELHCVTCGQKLWNGLEIFGATGQEQCQCCFLDPLDRFNEVDEADEYLQLIYLDLQDEETLPCVTLHGQSTRLLL